MSELVQCFVLEQGQPMSARPLYVMRTVHVPLAGEEFMARAPDEKVIAHGIVARRVWIHAVGDAPRCYLFLKRIPA